MNKNEQEHKQNYRELDRWILSKMEAHLIGWSLGLFKKRLIEKVKLRRSCEEMKDMDRVRKENGRQSIGRLPKKWSCGV